MPAPSHPGVWPVFTSWRDGRDRIVVSTSRCGRENPCSNPGHGRELRNLSVMAFDESILDF